jgi:hypothetical protein
MARDHQRSARTTILRLAAVLLFLGAGASADARQLVQELDIPRPRLSSTPEGAWTRVELPGGVMEVPQGHPALPHWEGLFLLDEGEEVLGVRIEDAQWETLPLERPPAPWAGPVGERDPHRAVGSPEPAIYGGTEIYPREVARVGEAVHAGDRWAVGVRVAVLRYDPVARELHWLRRGRVVLETRRTGAPPEGAFLKRLRPRAGKAQTGLLRAERGFHPSAMPSLEGSSVDYVIVTSEDQRAAWDTLAVWKTRMGTPTVVRTVEEILAAYPNGADAAERLRRFLQDAYAYWGIRYALLAGDPGEIPVRYAHTWSWNQPVGVDILCDYYFACLDGTWNADADAVFGEPQHNPDNPLGDGADLGGKMDVAPDIQVGRIPAGDAAKAAGYLEKYFRYVTDPPDDGYLGEMLLVSEVLFEAGWVYGDCDTCEACPMDEEGNRRPCVTQDGAEDSEEVILRLQAAGLDLQVTRMYERDYYWSQIYENVVPTTMSGLLNRLNSGVNLIHHVGHGDVERWAVGSDPQSSIELRFVVSDANALTNGQSGHISGLAYAINCNSAAIDFNCLAEAMVGNPDGGVVSYVGSTNLDFPGTARQFQNLFYDRLFDRDATVGDAHYWALMSRGANMDDESDTPRRFLIYSLILLGDPQMQVWLGNPDSLLLTFQQQVPLGTQELEITVETPTGDPVEGAKVTLSKDGESYAVGTTDADGRVTLPLFATGTGEFQVAAVAPQSLPAVGTGEVVSSGEPLLVVRETLLREDGTGGSVGNGNGQAELGETFLLGLRVENTGGATATDVEAVLRFGDPTWADVVVLQDTLVQLGEIPPQGEAVDSVAFRVYVPRVVPEEMEEELKGGDRMDLGLELILSHAGGQQTIPLELTASRPRLVLVRNRVDDTPGDGRQGDGDGAPENGETVDIYFEVWNRGLGQASNLRGTLIGSPQGGQVLDGVVAAPEIPPDSLREVGPFRVQLDSLRLFSMTFFLQDTLDANFPLALHWAIRDLPAPSPPDSIWAVGQRSSIILQWRNPTDAPEGLLGARIYRAMDRSGPYEPIFHGLVFGSVEGPSYFSDDGLLPLTRYYYYLDVVDSSGSVSAYSDTLETTTSPGILENWPVLLDEATRSSPTITELDGWAKREILFGSDVIYAVRGDGMEYYDGDHVSSTRGPLSEGLGTHFAPLWCKIATWDLDGDGDVELVGLHKTGSPEDSSRSALAVYDDHGRLLWFRTLGRHGVGSPAIGEVDGTDPEFEIAVANSNKIYLFNHDGSSAVPGNANGVLLAMSEAKNLYQTPCLADLDDDGVDEVVLVTWNGDQRSVPGKLWAVNGDGSVLAGYPVDLADYAPSDDANTGAVVAADLDQDGALEIAFQTGRRFWIFEADGTLRLLSAEYRSLGNDGAGLQTPAIGDIDRDGVLDVVYGAKHQNGLWLHAIRGTATTYADTSEVPGFPTRISENKDADPGSPILVNMDGDPYPEIVIGDSDGFIHVYDHAGNPVSGFPYVIAGGDMRYGGLAAWDVDGDGSNNLVIQSDISQEVIVLDLGFAPFPEDEAEQAAQNPWPMKHHDVRNTGSLVSDIMTPVLLSQVEGREIAPGQVQIRFQSVADAAAFLLWRQGPGEGSWELRGRLDPPGSGVGSFVMTDAAESPGLYFYRIDIEWPDGSTTEGAFLELRLQGRPVRLALQPLRPNPFRDRTTLRFVLPRPGQVSIRILDVTGRRVRTLLDGALPAGSHELVWDGRNDRGRRVAAGLYLVTMRSGEGMRHRRVLLLR